MGKDYDNMSREELVDMVGGKVDPDISREELIVMAMESEQTDIM